MFVQPAPVAPAVQRDEHGILVMGDTRLRAGQGLRGDLTRYATLPSGSTPTRPPVMRGMGTARGL